VSFNFITISFTNNILNSVEQILDSSNTSIAPPKRSAHSSNSSFLPPAPTVSSSRVRINREPTIATTREDASDEGESDEDETDGDDDNDEKEKVVPALRFGPPKGRRVKSDHSVEGNLLFSFYYLILFIILARYGPFWTQCLRY